MPTFGRWAHSTFKDSAIINEKPISEMPSLPPLRACIWAASQQQPSLLTLLGQWMGPQLRTREIAPFAGLLCSVPSSAKVPRQVCHAEKKKEKINVWQEGQWRRMEEQSRCPNFRRRLSSMNWKWGRRFPPAQWGPGLATHLLSSASPHHRQLSSLASGPGCSWVPAPAPQRGAAGHLSHDFCCAEVPVLKA